MESLERRIAQLERSNRWQRGLLAAAGGVMLVVLCGGGGPAEGEPPAMRYGPIKSTAFMLVDAKGNPRGMMAMSGDMPIISVLKPDSSPGALLTVGHEGGNFSAWDGYDKRLVVLEANKHGGALHLFSRKNGGEAVAMLTVNEEDSGRCEVCSPDGRTGRAIMESRSNMGVLGTVGPDGKPTGMFP